MSMQKTYLIETYGCQMNIAESSALENTLQEAGWVATEDETLANVVILNTCSVRKTAESRIWGRLGFFGGVKSARKQATSITVGTANPQPLTIIVMGCMGERLREAFKQEAPMVDYVFGTQDQHLIPMVLLGGTAGAEGALSAVGYADKKGYSGQQDIAPSDNSHTTSGSFQFRKNHTKEGAFKAFVPIMHGCNNFCTYCIVPYVRGREVSRDPDEILAEVHDLAAQGVKKITLLGQNVNSYRWKDLEFPELLRRIAQNCGNIRWIDFLSSHPKDLSPALIEVMATEPKVTRNLHLPVQHGSNRILEEMNRKYTAEHYLDLVRRLRKAIPDLTLTSDIMVGFPGETEADLKQLKDLMQEARFIQAFTYYYNQREGTKAANFSGQLTDKVKKARLAEIITLQHDIGHAEKEALVGTNMTVLVEGVSKKSKSEWLGRTQSDLMVVFPHNPQASAATPPDTAVEPNTAVKPGDCVKVSIESVQGNTLRGHLVSSADCSCALGGELTEGA